MSQTTYRKISEFIINQHYNGMPLPEASITTRHIAERVAIKVAKFAQISAFQNSKQGETTFSNDQFISVFKSLSLLTDNVTNDKYVVLPATPAGLPNNQEIVQVSFTGSPNVHVVPMKNKDDFAQGFLPAFPSTIALYKIENGNIVFKQLNPIVNSPVNVKMIGAVSGATLLDSVLNVPKDVEDSIITEILQELTPNYSIKPQNIEVGEPN